ncbi:MAG: major facilitator transporter [Rhodocyclaceae bacterium]|nr:MAG: major facilitator transporter [Rhodocyclaceae bacterium]TND04573.1 MAG: major facilitator transporter [Rhodocyclaceae bacterium]
MNLWLRVFLPFAAGYYFSYFLRNVNAVIAPELTRELAVSAADLGLLTSAYLLAFGAVQLPLGLALDRYGPRRVEAFLLLIAAAGCALFAAGSSLTELAIARALIGLGVSACLMASFKAFSQWFGTERQASLNAAIMAAGGLGALTASTPLSWAIPQFGWRAVFVALAVAGLAAAAGIFSTPDKTGGGQQESLRSQLAGLAEVLASRAFWRYAPQSTLIIGGFLALQGLWAVPWLMNFSGLPRDAAAHHLLLMGSGMLVGFLGIAFGVAPLAARGLGPLRLLQVGMGIGLLATLLIVLGAEPGEPLWFIFGLVFSVGNLAYALLQGHYNPALAGRVNTALNLMVFVGAFFIQWGFGAAVDALQAGGYALRAAYQITFGGLLALQVASWLWFLKRN